MTKCQLDIPQTKKKNKKRLTLRRTNKQKKTTNKQSKRVKIVIEIIIIKKKGNLIKNKIYEEASKANQKPKTKLSKPQHTNINIVGAALRTIRIEFNNYRNKLKTLTKKRESQAIVIIYICINN